MPPTAPIAAGGPLGNWPPPVPHGPYVLVADADSGRVATCVAAIEAAGSRARVAPGPAQAIALLHRHGPPVLLIVDLSLPDGAGFAIAAAAAGSGPSPAILAWASSRGMREFAGAHLAAPQARILRATSPPSVVRAAIGRVLAAPPSGDRHARADLDAGAADEYSEGIFARLSEKARDVSSAAGVAVYARAPHEAQFRAAVSWLSDTPLPQSPAWMPDVFGLLLQSGQPIILPDLANAPSALRLPSMVDSEVGGIVAVPLTASGRRTVGMICLFDVRPLDIDDERVDALLALARLGSDPYGRDSSVAVDASDEGRQTAAGPRVVEPRAVREPTVTVRCEIVPFGRQERPLSVMRVDVDAADPDRDLAAASHALKRVIRDSDVMVQWDQAQCLVVLPDIGPADAQKVAERVRSAMQLERPGASYAEGRGEPPREIREAAAESWKGTGDRRARPGPRRLPDKE